MLVPAIAMKSEVIQKFREMYYTDDMYYLGYGIIGCTPNIDDNSDDKVQYAIVNQNKVIGYFKYDLSLSTMCASNFMAISFEKGNYVIGRDLYNEIRKLLYENNIHRMEWGMIGGNPMERHYDRFIDKWEGYKNKHVLRDSCIDKYGKFRDYIIYEIINDSEK